MITPIVGYGENVSTTRWVNKKNLQKVTQTLFAQENLKKQQRNEPFFTAYSPRWITFSAVKEPMESFFRAGANGREIFQWVKKNFSGKEIF